MRDEDRKLLTEYIGECWHEPGYRVSMDSPVMQCAKCKKYYHPMSGFRTFTTRDDMMDLYKAIVKRGEWGKFTEEIYYDWEDTRGFVRPGSGEFHAWLFCLSGDGYEEKCQMVADWVKEASHES